MTQEPVEPTKRTPEDIASGIDTGEVDATNDALLSSVTFEVVEKGLEGGQKVSRKGIFLLPNLFTTGALFSGFYAILAGLNHAYGAAVLALFWAIILDGLDGRIARLTNTQSDFGAEYDSLSDMVAFGVAPALLIFNWSLGAAGKFGWMVSFVYLACTALRLARFNVQTSCGADKRFFTGIPSPVAAGLLGSVIWVGFDVGWDGRSAAYLVSIFTLIIAVLMVCNLQYYSFKDLDFRGRVPFAMIVVAIIVIAVVFLDPPKVILGALLLYAISGVVLSVRRCVKRAPHRQKRVEK